MVIWFGRPRNQPTKWANQNQTNKPIGFGSTNILKPIGALLLATFLAPWLSLKFSPAFYTERQRRHGVTNLLLLTCLHFTIILPSSV